MTLSQHDRAIVIHDLETMLDDEHYERHEQARQKAAIALASIDSNAEDLRRTAIIAGWNFFAGEQHDDIEDYLDDVRPLEPLSPLEETIRDRFIAKLQEAINADIDDFMEVADEDFGLELEPSFWDDDAVV